MQKNRVEFKLKEPINNSYLINEYSKYIFMHHHLILKVTQKQFRNMAAGCIVLASDIENNRELIRDNENGFYTFKNFEISKIIENYQRI